MLAGGGGGGFRGDRGGCPGGPDPTPPFLIFYCPEQVLRPSPLFEENFCLTPPPPPPFFLNSWICLSPPQIRIHLWSSCFLFFCHHIFTAIRLAYFLLPAAHVTMGQSSTNGGAIAGGVVAAMVLLAVFLSVVTGLLCFLRRRNKVKSMSYDVL